MWFRAKQRALEFPADTAVCKQSECKAFVERPVMDFTELRRPARRTTHLVPLAHDHYGSTYPYGFEMGRFAVAISPWTISPYGRTTVYKLK